MAEMAHAKGLKVVLTGEGSDEHFAGYAEFLADSVLEPDRSWPASLGLDRDAALRSTGVGHGVNFYQNEVNRMPTPAQRMFNFARFPQKIASVNRLPFAAWTDRCTDVAPETALAECFDGRVLDSIINKWHPLHTAEYVWTKTCFVSFLLRYVGDNIDLGHHIESRPPFLDHQFTEYVNGLPPSLKMKCGPHDTTFREKHILREAVKPFVTEEIYERSKKPYIGPTRVLKRLLTRENVDGLGFVDWDRVSTSFQRAFEEKDQCAFRNTLLVAQFVVLSQRFQVRTAQPADYTASRALCND